MSALQSQPQRQQPLGGLVIRAPGAPSPRVPAKSSKSGPDRPPTIQGMLQGPSVAGARAFPKWLARIRTDCASSAPSVIHCLYEFWAEVRGSSWKPVYDKIPICLRTVPFLGSGSPLFCRCKALTYQISPPYRMLLPTPQHRYRYYLATIATALENI